MTRPPRQRPRASLAALLVLLAGSCGTGCIGPNVPTAVRSNVDAQKNLQAIVMAVYRYSAANGDRLPDDVVGKDGKPLLSWRVLLLPHLGHDDLYKKFKLDEAWDSTNNLPLVGLMPAVFASSRLPTKEAGHTVYQGFSGPDGLFRTGKEPYLINRVPDGPTLTLLAVESSNPVPWSKPEDIPFDKHKDVPNFGSAYGGRPWAVLLDGKVRVLDLGKIRPDTLKYAINPNDGTVPGDDWKP